MLRWVILIGYAILTVSCAAPTTSVRVLVPAEHHEVTQFRNISVLPFQGRKGERIADELESELVGIYINQQPFFTVVERVRMKHALAELELGQTGLLDEQSAVQVGRMIGAEALYTGRILAAQVDQEYYTEKRSHCSQRKDPDKLFSECLRWSEKTVGCSKKIATFQFSPKVIVVESGQVIYAKNINKAVEDSRCDDDANALIGDRALLQQAKNSAFQVFIKDVAPTYVDQQLTMMDGAEGLNQSASTQLALGLEFAQKARMERACELWQEAIQLNGRASMSLIYNLGVCAETQARYQQALKFYRQSERYSPAPNDTIIEAITRIKRKIQQKEALKSQL